MLNSSPTSTSRVLGKKIFKVIYSPWSHRSSQLTRLSYYMSMNTRQQHGFISSNNQSSQLKTAIMTNNNNGYTDTLDNLTQQKMNLHNISTKKCPLPREKLYSFTSRIRLHTEKNLFSETASLNRIYSRSSSTSNKPSALMVISELKELRTAPVPALALGFSGLIPFVSVPMYMIMTSTYVPDISFAQTAYGAVILSFLGGVRWGHAVSHQSTFYLSWTSLGQSVVPSLIAWPALLLPIPFSTLVVAAGLGGLAYFDVVASIYAPWFKALRFVLSFVAVIALWSSIMCYLLMSQNQQIQPAKKENKEA